MAIKRFGDYEKTQAYGDYEGFYAKEYKAQQSEDKKWHCNYLLNIPNDDGSEKDNWTKRRFKTFTEALEESNPGYRFDWDEQKFKGKIAGGLFNEREYGDYKLPKDKILSSNNSSRANSDDFMSVPDGTDEELPFN